MLATNFLLMEKPLRFLLKHSNEKYMKIVAKFA